MTEKRQTSQGYIILILHHFATKLRNITNFAMLFQVVMKFLSRLVYIKISLKRGKVYSNKTITKRICPNGPKLCSAKGMASLHCSRKLSYLSKFINRYIYNVDI
jgi:hypothetical protein